MNNTIFETFMLPSKGKVYDTEINPIIELSSMKVWQEMKRLSPTDTPYKLMSDIIEECMQNKPEISVYDMCLGDYQFLLYKLRTVTYGSKYKMNVSCPYCGTYEEVITDLDDIEVLEYEDDYENLKQITLPVSNNLIELQYQTPRKLDEISRKAKEYKKKLKTNIDYTLLFTLMSVIKKIDGQEVNEVMLENFCKNLDMKDTQTILKGAEALNDKVGVSNDMVITCSICNKEFTSPFRLTSEFFGPTI